ncbi:sialoadhesin-like [Poeciliopsis prolifica]|uniref:sialoadhesin-like n=1 Tax=Poeciliopsis prolifica TaxID=188132 RepID=UPI0024144592|nr:sialoadhesin-like [Poeciliopsis prolifica]
MRQTLLCMLGFFCIKATLTADRITILAEAPHRVSVILHPSWPQIYREETVILRCHIQEAAGAQWTYEWRTTNRKSLIRSEYMNISATEAHRGEYSCRGRGEGLTPWSNAIKLTVSPKPQPVLSVSPSWPNPGASVTLSCEGLELQSAGWRFFWYKAVPDLSSRYSYKLLPGSTNGTKQNSFTINGSTQTAGFVCRGGRGEPKFYTYYSEPTFVWSGDPGPAASLSVNPDRVQHFSSDSVSLSCEGNFTEWRVRRFTETGRLSDCFYWGTMTGSTCTINQNSFHSGVYWCESRSGETSNAINITVQDDFSAPLLVSPVHPVTEGDPVTLSCRQKNEKLLSGVFFNHNDKLLYDGSRGELNISAVSKSDEGFYKCQHSGKESPRSWMSVREAVSRPVGSLLLVLLIVGPVSGIILLLSLCCCIRLFLAGRRSQSSTVSHAAKQDGCQVYNSLRQGDASLYEQIETCKAAENGRPRHPEEDCVYVNVKPVVSCEDKNYQPEQRKEQKRKVESRR